MSNKIQSEAESLGRAAFQDGKGLDANPFSWLRDGNKRWEWSIGWFAARDHYGKEWMEERCP